MMVTLAPYYKVRLVEMTIDGEKCYALPMTTKLNLAGDTEAATIRKSLEEAKSSSLYSEWQASFDDDVIDGATVKNEKNYKQLVKDIKKESK